MFFDEDTLKDEPLKRAYRKTEEKTLPTNATLISYDFTEESHDDYVKVKKIIEEDLKCYHLQRSIWVGNFDSDAEDIARRLLAAMSKADLKNSKNRLFVSKLTRNAVWTHAECEQETPKKSLIDKFIPFL